YGSVDTHGLALVDDFLADGWTVIYRPHPLTGVRDDAGYGAADRAIRDRLAREAEHGAAHRIDGGIPLSHSFADADLLVCDISSVAVEWLPVDRPLALTESRRTEALVATSPLTEVAPRIAADEMAGVANRLR